MSTRKWRKGDEEPLCAYLNEDACYLVADRRGRLWLRRTEETGGSWDRLSTRFGKAGVADWRYLVATYGPVTEVISSTEEEAPGQAGVDAFSVCTCNAEDETKCFWCGRCERCHGACDCGGPGFHDLSGDQPGH